MAQIIERKSKDGKISYLIRVSNGYDLTGKQKKQSMTWIPPEELTPAKIKKALSAAALKFEEQVAAGAVQDGNIRFYQFAEKFMKEYASKNLKRKTYSEYENRLERINQAIGNIRMCDLKTGHINSFYANMAEDGIRKGGKLHAKADISEMLKAQKLTKTAFSEKSGCCIHAVRAAMAGGNVDRATAEKIASALGKKVSDLFAPCDDKPATLSSTSIRTYHATLSSILSKAVKWGVIPFNPAANAEIPKVRHIETSHLDEADAKRLLELLQGEQMNYRAAVTFDLLSGLRRAELLGLRWTDIDFDTDTITIRQTSNYLPKVGVYTDTPKNETSARRIKLAHSLFLLLGEYRAWQNEQRDKCGDLWQDKDGRVFTSLFGAPIFPDTVTGWFKSFIRKHNFPDVHFHSLRHTYASLMIADGTPLVVVSRRLGHAQVSTTSNIYAHVIQSADEKAAQISDKFADSFLSIPQKKQV